MITPAISVLSAVEGLEVVSPSLESLVVPIALAILTAMFVIQRFGTGAVGRLFGPVMGPVEHSNALHRNVVILSIDTLRVPHVPVGEQVSIDDLGYRDDGISHADDDRPDGRADHAPMEEEAVHGGRPQRLEPRHLLPAARTTGPSSWARS